jgi:hypothetical protein
MAIKSRNTCSTDNNVIFTKFKANKSTSISKKIIANEIRVKYLFSAVLYSFDE